MKTQVHFYAQLRELTRVEGVDVDLTEGATVSDVLQEIYRRFPPLRVHDNSILIGAGLEFVDRSYKLKPGEEIAIMPPVQGG